MVWLKPPVSRPIGIVVVVIFVVLFIFLCIPRPDSSRDFIEPIQETDDSGQCLPSEEKFAPIIHQIWLNYTAFPREWVAPVGHCKLLNPDHKYMLWTAKSFEAFLIKNYNWFLPTYKSYKHNVQRTDAARLFILYEYGGVYIDMDIDCVLPFTNITSELRQYDVILNRGDTFGVSNAIMLAKPRHPYIKLSIDSLVEHNRWLGLSYITIMYTAGPGFLTVMLRQYPCKQQIHIFPPEPLNNRYYVNLHGGSWHTWDTHVIDGLGTVHKTIHRYISWTAFITAVVIALFVFLYDRLPCRNRTKSLDKILTG